MKPNKQFIMLGAMIAVIVIIYIITTIFKKNGTKKDNKTNDSLKENLKITAILYVIGVAAGMAVDFLGITL